MNPSTGRDGSASDNSTKCLQQRTTPETKSEAPRSLIAQGSASYLRTGFPNLAACGAKTPLTFFKKENLDSSALDVYVNTFVLRPAPARVHLTGGNIQSAGVREGGESNSIPAGGPSPANVLAVSGAAGGKWFNLAPCTTGCTVNTVL